MTGAYRDRLYADTAFKGHNAAFVQPWDCDAPLISMLDGWLAYADHHHRQYESSIGEDYVLGPEWAAIGRALLGLLNGVIGRLDCGTLDGLIRGVLAAEGFGEE